MAIYWFLCFWASENMITSKNQQKQRKFDVNLLMLTPPNTSVHDLPLGLFYFYFDDACPLSRGGVLKKKNLDDRRGPWYMFFNVFILSTNIYFGFKQHLGSEGEAGEGDNTA